jgi:NDP-sugar pyrophosphorylase family protein
MRAIILATGNSPATAALNEHYPTPLFPLADRPFLQHVIEYCVNQGVTQFDFVLSHLPERIEHYFGDGKRWGSRFTYHLARDPSHPYRLLKALDLTSGPNGALLLGHADRLPQLNLRETGACGSPPVLFSWRDATGTALARRWTGWALLAPQHIAALPADADENGLELHLQATVADERCWRELPPPLSIATFDDLLAAHHAVLTKAFSGLLLSGREADPGIWLSRNVKLHPTAQLVPPVYVGENCSIGAGVELGPDAVIGRDCILDSHCKVLNSVIFPGSYVGEGLEPTDVILDKNRLINVRLGGAVDVADNFLIGSLSEGQLWPWTVRLFARLVALLFLVAATPVLLLTALWLKLIRPGQILFQKEVIYLPAPLEEPRWHSFQLVSFDPDDAPDKVPGQGITCSFRALLLRFVPGLINIVKGNLAFVGVPPRSSEEIRLLPHDWRVLYLRAKAGIVTEASVRFRTPPDDDERYAAEAFYVATANWRYDMKLLVRFLAQSLLGFPRPGVAQDLAAVPVGPVGQEEVPAEP